MSITITMPALSPTMEEGILARWLVKEGDQISSGDIIAEIETDKATMEVEAVDEGVLAKILIDGGSEGVKVNTPIALLAEDGEDPDTVSVPADRPAAPSAAPKLEKAPPAPTSKSTPPIQPPTAQPQTRTPSTPSQSRIKASPLAKRIAAQKGLDLSMLKGSGPNGRIIKRDVETAQALPAPQSAAPEQMAASLDPRIYPVDSYELVPLDGMRKTVASRLTQSFMHIPHFPLQIDLQIDRLLAARKAINEAAPEGVKISVNDILIKASAMALIKIPEANASFTDEGIAYHKSANISVAVAVDGGLITPVIFAAEQKGLSDISANMKDLAERARSRKLKPQEYMGGTFSLSNLGMFGIKSFGSIINPPEGMILSVGAGEERPIILDGEFTKATMMSVTLTCDHRVVDGAVGAKWLAAFKAFVESPESMLL